MNTPLVSSAIAILAGCLAACGGRAPAKQSPGEGLNGTTITASASQFCTLDSPISISRDSIWRLPLRSPLRALQSACPSSRDTSVRGEERGYPGLRFSFQGLRAIAVQYRNLLRLDEPPDVWIIVGGSAVLPQGLPLDVSWTQLHAAYGDAVASTEDEDGLTVKFCRLPNFFFTLNSSMAPQGLIRDFTRVPAAARVKELRVMIEPPGWGC
jgi:hypothetical protein